MGTELHFRLWNWSFASWKANLRGFWNFQISQSMLAGEIIGEQSVGSGSSKRVVKLRNLIVLPRWLDFIHKRSLLAVWTLSFATTGYYLALKVRRKFFSVCSSKKDGKEFFFFFIWKHSIDLIFCFVWELYCFYFDWLNFKY